MQIEKYINWYISVSWKILKSKISKDAKEWNRWPPEIADSADIYWSVKMSFKYILKDIQLGENSLLCAGKTTFVTLIREPVSCIFLNNPHGTGDRTTVSLARMFCYRFNCKKKRAKELMSTSSSALFLIIHIHRKVIANNVDEGILWKNKLLVMHNKFKKKRLKDRW